MRYFLILMTSAILISGCASQNDVSLKMAEYNARIEEAKAQRDSDVSFWGAFKEIGVAYMNSGADEGGKSAFMSNMDDVAEEMREAVESQVSEAKTGVDAQIKAAEEFGDGLPMATVGVVGYKAMKERGEVNISSNGGDIKDSGNTQRKQNFVNGEGNSSSVSAEKDVSKDTTEIKE